MRLVQLARLLQISPSVLEEFLKHRQAAPAGAHARLADEDITAAVIHFAPEKLREILAVRESAEEPQSEGVSVQDTATEIDNAADNTQTAPVESPADAGDGATIEVIRAPKVELPGLRVVGKIDLPEPVKREKPETSREENPRPGRSGRQPSERGEFRQSRRRESARNPVQEQRERQQREAEERRKEEIRQAKERRTLAYVKQQTRREQKPAQPKTKQKAQPDSGARPNKPLKRPTSWLGRFWRWLAHGE